MAKNINASVVNQPSGDHVRKDLKKLLITLGSLVIIMIGLAIVDQRTGFLGRLVNQLMK